MQRRLQRERAKTAAAAAAAGESTTRASSPALPAARGLPPPSQDQIRVQAELAVAHSNVARSVLSTELRLYDAEKLEEIEERAEEARRASEAVAATVLRDAEAQANAAIAAAGKVRADAAAAAERLRENAKREHLVAAARGAELAKGHANVARSVLSEELRILDEEGRARRAEEEERARDEVERTRRQREEAEAAASVMLSEAEATAKALLEDAKTEAERLQTSARGGSAGAAATERDAQLASSHFNATRHVLKEELRIIEEEARARREEEAARERLSVEEALQEARRELGSITARLSHAKTQEEQEAAAAVARQHWLQSPPPQSHPSTQRWEEFEPEWPPLDDGEEETPMDDGQERTPASPEPTPARAAPRSPGVLPTPDQLRYNL